MYIERKIESQLKYLAAHFPVVVVSGARQTGKTTLVKETFGSRENVTYVTLDYPIIRNLAKNDPELFLQQYQPPVIIDEIQYAPELLVYIKIQVDDNRIPGQYYLTGSQMFRMMKNVSESLAGRVGLLSLFGFSRSEVYAKPEVPFLPSNTHIEKSKETVITVSTGYSEEVCRN